LNRLELNKFNINGKPIINVLKNINMKSNKVYQSIIFILVCVISFSCSNGKLTNRKAKRIIKEFYEYPNVETRTFTEYHGFWNSDFEKPQFATIINTGFVNRPEKREV
jgi:hypothetical protein